MIRMKKLIYILMAALAVLGAVSCEEDKPSGNGGDPGNNDEPAIVVPEEVVNMGMVLPCLDAEGNPLKDEEGNVITYKLYWAKTNLTESGFCATPGDNGDYFAWGETETKSGYTWATYKWGQSATSLIKYNTLSSNGEVDNKTELDSGPEGDDVASKILGAPWRMPTYTEWKNLLEACEWERASQNGRDGRMATADNGNSIFFTFAGYKGEYGLIYEKIEGDYWSTSLYSGNPKFAWCFHVKPAKDEITAGGRSGGFSIRPVWEEVNPKDPVEGSVWYTHSEEDDVEQGHQDIVWKLAFAEENKVSITGTANDEAFSEATGTYSASGSKPVQLSLSCKQPNRTVVFKTFSALADGRWKLDCEFQYDNDGPVQTYFLIFVNGRIPDPDEVMGL